MRQFIVAVASTFDGNNKVFKVSANSPDEARRKALELAGWDVNVRYTTDELIDQIDDIVSEAYGLFDHENAF